MLSAQAALGKGVWASGVSRRSCVCVYAGWPGEGAMLREPVDTWPWEHGECCTPPPPPALSLG